MKSSNYKMIQKKNFRQNLISRHLVAGACVSHHMHVVIGG